MSIFTAFFDASGRETAPDAVAMSVCGFVSNEAKWGKFETEWYALLEQHGIEPPFHMTDFMAAKSKKYRLWKDRHEEFLVPALSLIKRRINKSFGHVLSLEDFARAHAEYVIPDGHYMATDIRRPLALCGVVVVQKLLDRWALPKSADGLAIDDLRIVFDRGDEHRGQLASALRKEFGIEPTFEDKSRQPPLQAADILAWYFTKGMRDYRHGKPLPPPGWTHMITQLPGGEQWSSGDWASLQQVCEQQRFVKRDNAVATKGDASQGSPTSTTSSP